MNILIPDSWLRDHLKTKATPKQLKDYLSLCGPSIERINMIGREPVYDIEITTNRVDAFSVRGVAREAAVILPEFGIPATLLPYDAEKPKNNFPKQKLGITFENDATLCYRILAIKISDITLNESPAWMKKRLELVGQRPLNNIVDITNYVMWEVGHPLHVFDYDRITGKKIIVRLGKKGEKLTTLNEKTHILHGGEIVFDDGTGTIIDLPGIMGTANTVVTDKTKNCMLFIENSDQVRIRRTSMGLAIRSQAAVINEKHPDPELALVAMKRAIDLTLELTGGKLTSELVDIYPEKPKPPTISVSKTLIDQYFGTSLEVKRIKTILERLGCTVTVSETKGDTSFAVKPPSFRSDDMTIPQDVIEEVARIAGYHTIIPRLPDREPPAVIPDRELTNEEHMKIRLRDWGYTEVYGYSMIGKTDLTRFSMSLDDVYAISNPLSEDHAYLRPTLLPSMLNILTENLSHTDHLSLFELSHTYHKQEKNLPKEESELLVAVSGENFLQLKGLAQAIFTIFGIEFPNTNNHAEDNFYKKGFSLLLGDYGSVGILDPDLLGDIGIKKPITILTMSVSKLVASANPHQSYEPIPKHPPVIEDFSFTFPAEQYIGPVLDAIKTIHPYIHTVSLLDSYGNKRTIRVVYLDPERTLTLEEVKPIREKIISHISDHFHAALQGT
jgi:phenylalanyl-tRNA synthetase beta chain